MLLALAQIPKWHRLRPLRERFDDTCLHPPLHSEVQHIIAWVLSSIAFLPTSSLTLGGSAHHCMGIVIHCILPTSSLTLGGSAFAHLRLICGSSGYCCDTSLLAFILTHSRAHLRFISFSCDSSLSPSFSSANGSLRPGDSQSPRSWLRADDH